ncbi:flavin reductase [Arthrobacter sulfonylureivorans]|uniref:Flavin reductase n=1 Tax=Arthrobacter sulfonylureivorans TaxID=2486855 RepID=A0ABY3W939_9MICC|nr:flavin reductase [Arthrobacter sulfonylureivorans]UNK45648.1 flavin reductase [Arthrobacter sulfonylureivorans]
MDQNMFAPAPAFDQDVFRQVVGHFASGVAVITTAHEGRLYGTTASAVSSLSMEPPMMLMCLNQSSSTHDAVAQAGLYAINILAEDQRDLAMKFGRKGGDKFDGVSFRLSEHGGVPILDGVIAAITCIVDETPRGGTHSVFFGRVVDAESSHGEPLAYYRGAFGRLERVKELDTYMNVRQWVLARRTPLGENLHISMMVEALRAEPDDVFNAFVKLTAEGLVDRTNAGAFIAAPITVDFSNSLYDGRATIEVGVIASRIMEFEQALLDRLRGMTEVMGQLRASENGSLREFLELHSNFHQTLVGASGSVQLLDSYRRLSIAGVWGEAWDKADWRTLLDHTHLTQLANSLIARDVNAAIEAVQNYTAQAKEFARIAIESRGGQV